MSCVYSLHDIRKTKETGGSCFVLEVPELELPRGARIAVTGSSGCGKSTLLDLLGLVAVPDEGGEVEVRPTLDVSARLGPRSPDVERAVFRRQYIGYVLQHGCLVPYLTIRQNLTLPLSLLGFGRDEAWYRHVLRELELDGLETRHPRHLSIGQRQRAAVARAVLHRPSVVLADEPTAAVDRANAARVRDLILGLAGDARASIVFVSHDLELLRGHFDTWVGFDVSRPAAGCTRSVARMVSSPA